MKMKLILAILAAALLAGCRSSDESGVIKAWTSQGPYRNVNATNSPPY